jgi:hypothetical protein
MCLWVSYKKKHEKNEFFALKTGVLSRIGSGSGTLVRDARIRIRTKISWFHNTAYNTNIPLGKDW